MNILSIFYQLSYQQDYDKKSSDVNSGFSWGNALMLLPSVILIGSQILKYISNSEQITSSTFYKNKEGAIFWYKKENEEEYQEISDIYFKSWIPLKPSDDEKEYGDFAWFSKIENATSNKEFERLLVEGKGRGILNKSFSEYPDDYSSFIIDIAKRESKKGFIPLAYHAGVEFGQTDARGNTALLWSIANACNGMAMKILETVGVGEYVNAADTQWGNNTALHLAVGKGYKHESKDYEVLEYTNLELVKKMISMNANVNIQNREGSTPLHLACARRDPEMIRALREAGADLSIKDQRGNTPQDNLDLTFNEAHSLLKVAVKAFLLDEIEFASNKQKAFEAMQSH